ncbi:WYL domain-containing protein [Pontibacter sp. G13]|uniref:helix-turn-helix transcriptional regulator n=1 Tax=Pontibacter sp. G13 TaxID=3074898 RepID=UPI0028895D5C|nr:WYL domain-containing protein [Pontibacter sp. G13]WNJ17322.1 WYL domain-containing protein [Pontibacter sp. G13]
MPANRNALLRYRTIDRCLKNHYQKWTLEDLIEACSDALYEYEGIDKGVSRRTVQGDINMMRSGKLGYEAPIEVVDKKYYVYADRAFSIDAIPLDAEDVKKLEEVVALLGQFQTLPLQEELSDMARKLQDRISVASNHHRPIIQLERNALTEGLDWMDTLYQAIAAEEVLSMTYQSFKADHPKTFVFHPWLLKEYRNRWFVLGKGDGQHAEVILALDRIKDIQPNEARYQYHEDPELVQNWFRDVIGVSANPKGSTRMVVLWVNHQALPYIRTKPLHHSMKWVDKRPDGAILSLEVQLNFELEREILGFGENVEVLEPQELRHRIQFRTQRMSQRYGQGYNPAFNYHAFKLLSRRGFAGHAGLYERSELDAIRQLAESHLKEHPDLFEGSIDQLFWHIPQLIPMILNKPLKEWIIAGLGGRQAIVRSAFVQGGQLAVPVKSYGQVSQVWLNAEQGQEAPQLTHLEPTDLKRGARIMIPLVSPDEPRGMWKLIPKTHGNLIEPPYVTRWIEGKSFIQYRPVIGGILAIKPLLCHQYVPSKQMGNDPYVVLDINPATLPFREHWLV